MTSTDTPTTTDLDGKVAVVTGAARGIGLRIAEVAAARGATVVVSDVDGDAAAAAAGRIEGATSTTCDVTDEDQVARLFESAVADHGRVDVAIANAGISDVAPLVELDLDRWRRMMSINLDGVFLTVKHAALAMIGAGNGGSIVTMASVTGTAGTPLVGHYAAAKAGVINLTRTAAVELRGAGIRVNAVCPGFAETELVTSRKAEFEQGLGIDDFEAVLEVAQGGWVSVDDIAAVTTWLASDRSRFCTGGAYTIDGGLTASLL